MFVGETGVQRVVSRTADLLREAGASTDVRTLGGIDLQTIQKYLNLWFSLSEDLFGSEISTNAASFFAQGLKGRAKEEKFQDHKVLEGSYAMDLWEEGPAPSVEGTWKKQEVPLRNAMNEVLRDAYIEDAQRGVDKWNKELEKRDLSFRLTLPHRRFHRQIGIYAGHFFDPQGNPISKGEWERRRDEWLPSPGDLAYVKSLQRKAIDEPGKMANWIAPPLRGINHQPMDFEYVRGE